MQELVETSPHHWQYGDWKIQQIDETFFQCVRIKPTKFFRATSLEAAVKVIDRREDPFLKLKLLAQTLDGES